MYGFEGEICQMVFVFWCVLLENSSFSLNNAILSRVRVYVLRALGFDAL